MSDPRDTHAVQDAVAAAWRQTRPTVIERVETVRRAADAAASDALGPAQREAAWHDAHKLVGLLGMYGIATGSELAREADRQLHGDGPIDGRALAAAARSLRTVVEQAEVRPSSG